MTADTVGMGLLLLGVLLYLGKLIRLKWGLAQRLFLPSSIIAGLLGLILGPDVTGLLVRRFITPDHVLADGLFGAQITALWSELPGLLINVVFATLLLGVALPKWRRVWSLAGPQLAFGVSLAAGQYVIGILLAVLILTPVFGLPPMVGALIEIGFEGGHGTAAGLADTFAELGFAEGADLALGMATVGVLSGMIFGIALINWGVRRGKSAVLDEAVQDMPPAQSRGVYDHQEEATSAGRMTVRPESIEPLTFHFALVAIAILVGLLLLEAMVWVESVTWGGPDGIKLLGAVPLFPLAMIGGLFVQLVLQRFDRHQLLDRQTMLRLQGFALDVLIVAAIASLSLQVIAGHLLPFALLGLAGIAWNVALFLYLAPRVIPDYWFERGIGDIGQSMGVTATGLILMKIADPDTETPAYEAFGYKQLVFEPFFGGGLITGLSLPLIYQFGPWPLFWVMLLLLAASLASGLLYFGRLKGQT